MDAVYVCRPGDRNEELRYSLRSLAAHVHHTGVWIFGSAPSWVPRDPDLVQVVERPKQRSKYHTTTEHVRAACEHPDVSDPFVLWNDDFYAVQPVGEMPVLHRGPLEDELKRWSGTAWARGQRQTHDLMVGLSLAEPLYSYELHVPLVVYKQPMLRAIEAGQGIPVLHKRTLYGNLAGIGGWQIEDVKITHELPDGPWWSSSDSTFRSRALPALRRVLPSPGPYELSERS